MTPAAPRIHSSLVAAAERLDDRTQPIMETCRRVGAVARALGLVRPSYEQVRIIVHAARRRGRVPSAGDVLLDVALRIRPVDALGDLLVDGSVPALRAPAAPGRARLLRGGEPLVQRLRPQARALLGRKLLEREREDFP